MGGGTRGARPSYSRGGGTGSSYGSLSKNLGSSTGSFAVRAFISFHVEDESQVQLLRHQAKDDRFDMEFTDYSVKEPFDEKWKSQCAERISQSSVVLVMIGQETYSREAVLWEINKAYELGKKVIGVRIYKDKNHRIPEPMVKNGAKIVNWTMQEIQAEIDRQ